VVNVRHSDLTHSVREECVYFMTTLILVSRSERSPSLKVYYNHVVLHSSAHVESKSAEGEAVRYFFFAGKATHVCLPQIAGLGGFARKLSPKVEQLRYSRRLQWSAGAIKLVFSIMTTLHYIQTCSDFVEQRSNIPIQGPLPLNLVSHIRM
jgi:hypothetical protein